MTRISLTPRERHLRVLTRNPVYQAYAAVHGRSIEAQYDHDGALFSSPAYLQWIAEEKARFLAKHPEQLAFGGGIRSHDAWFAYLAALAQQGFV